MPEYNKKSYSPRPYDKNWYIERSRQRQAASSSSSAAQAPSTPSAHAQENPKAGSTITAVTKKKVAFQTNEQQSRGGTAEKRLTVHHCRRRPMSQSSRTKRKRLKKPEGAGRIGFRPVRP